MKRRSSGWKRSPKRTQSARDRFEIESLLVSYAPLFEDMNSRLRCHSKQVLLEAANLYSRVNGINAPTRICSRQRPALVCWFIENAPEFPRGLDPSVLNPAAHTHLTPTAEPTLPPEEFPVFSDYEDQWEDFFETT
jgi:hypothetical protein